MAAAPMPPGPSASGLTAGPVAFEARAAPALPSAVRTAPPGSPACDYSPRLPEELTPEWQTLRSPSGSPATGLSGTSTTSMRRALRLIATTLSLSQTSQSSNTTRLLTLQDQAEPPFWSVIRCLAAAPIGERERTFCLPVFGLSKGGGWSARTGTGHGILVACIRSVWPARMTPMRYSACGTGWMLSRRLCSWNPVRHPKGCKCQAARVISWLVRWAQAVSSL